METASRDAETTLDELGEELRQAAQRTSELERDLEESQASARTATERAEDLESRLDDSETRLEEALVSGRDSAEMVEAHSEELGQLRDELGRLGQLRDELARELASSEAELADLRDRNAELTSASEQQDAVIEGLQSELLEKLDTIEQLGRDADQMAELEARIRSLDDRLAQAQDREPARRHSPVTRVMVTVNSDRAVKYPLYKDVMTIGRSADSDIRIRRQYISRHHARLHQDAGATYIEDLGSKNGVRVNAAPIDRQQLRDGDLVDIGRLQFRFIDLMASRGVEGNA